MPFRRRRFARKKQKTFRRRPFRKFSRKGKKKSSFKATKVRQTTLADQVYVKLKKTIFFDLNSGGDSIDLKLSVIGGNNFTIENPVGTAITPDVTPANYAQYAQQYESCRILGSSINVKAINTTGTVPAVITVLPTADEPVEVNEITFTNVLDQTYSRWKHISPMGGMDRCMIKNYMSTKKMFGHKIDESGADGASSTYKIEHGYTDGVFSSFTEPNQPWNWIIGIMPLNSSEAVAEANAVAVITYYCRFEERLDQVAFTNPE